MEALMKEVRAGIGAFQHVQQLLNLFLILRSQRLHSERDMPDVAFRRMRAADSLSCCSAVVIRIFFA
ncbi:hypothetical protein D3C71_2189200 [compost metagenome]